MRSSPASDGLSPRSSGRVAQAGNGNSTTSGTGICGWWTNIVPGLAITRALLVRLGQEPVLGPGCLRRVEATGDANRRVGDDAPLDLARGLLRADEDDAERAAALGDVEQDLLDRRFTVAGRVLVELVEHDEQQRLVLPGALLVVERPAQGDADDEPLRTVVEVVEIDDGDLRGCIDPVSQQRVGGDVGADDPSEGTLRRQQPPDERVDGAHARGRSGPVLFEVVVGDSPHDELDEVAIGAQRLALDAPAAVARGLTFPLQPRGDVVHDHRVLLTFVLGVGEDERQQLIGRELLDRPEERGDPELAVLDVGPGVRVVAPGGA